MQSRIEPPVLLSRLLTFVFAGCVVVLFVMFMTLEKMFPLNRPEVFFITSKPEGASVIQITELPPNDQNLEAYRQAFVMEYVRARNEIEQNMSIMQQKWGTNNGVVAAWSTPDIYKVFQKTGLYNAIMIDYPDVPFSYYCSDSNGQTEMKDYTILVGIEMADDVQIKWTERLNNPLGIKVSEYKVEGGGGDPLDTVYR